MVDLIYQGKALLLEEDSLFHLLLCLTTLQDTSAWHQCPPHRAKMGDLSETEGKNLILSQEEFSDNSFFFHNEIILVEVLLYHYVPLKNVAVTARMSVPFHASQYPCRHVPPGFTWTHWRNCLAMSSVTSPVRCCELVFSWAYDNNIRVRWLLWFIIDLTRPFTEPMSSN